MPRRKGINQKVPANASSLIQKISSHQSSIYFRISYVTNVTKNANLSFVNNLTAVTYIDLNKISKIVSYHSNFCNKITYKNGNIGNIKSFTDLCYYLGDLFEFN